MSSFHEMRLKVPARSESNVFQTYLDSSNKKKRRKDGPQNGVSGSARARAGAGCGSLGIGLAALGLQVVLTDPGLPVKFSEAEEGNTLGWLRANVDAN